MLDAESVKIVRKFPENDEGIPLFFTALLLCAFVVSAVRAGAAAAATAAPLFLSLLLPPVSVISIIPVLSSFPFSLTRTVPSITRPVFPVT